MSKRIDFSQATPADNPFASALSSALASSGLELRESAQGVADPEMEQAPRAKGTLELRLERRNGKPTGRFRVELQRGTDRYRQRWDNMKDAKADEAPVTTAHGP